MKQFKKRTLALVLASAVTVVGSFAAERYNNRLMAVAFNFNKAGQLQMLIETEKAYNVTIKPVKKSDDTYVIKLPQFTTVSNVPIMGSSKGVSNIYVGTMPYTNSSDGYTKITVKTQGSSELAVFKRVYIPSKQMRQLVVGYAKNVDPEAQEQLVNGANNTAGGASAQPAKKDYFAESQKNIDSGDKSTETLMLVLALLLIMAVSVYCYIKAKDKLTQITGERINLDLSDDDDLPSKKKPEKKKNTQIRSSIKNLDAKYPKSATMVSQKKYSAQEAPAPKTIEIKPVEPVEELNIVDLDEIFQEQVKAKTVEEIKEEEENSALEDFLSGFSFDEEVYEEPQNDDGYDVAFYEKALNNEKLNFTSNDIECINKILNSEINDATMRDIEKYAVSNPIKKVPTKEQILEDFVTTYAISHSITFTSEDISSLFKLISVEIDQDFITDLRTNPERTKEMYEEIKKSSEKTKKPSEILTLNVKDVLPDLSEALNKQGSRRIESERKAETIYFSEGYDVKKLKISDALPDLTKAIGQKESYVSKPTAEYDIVDNSYTVNKLKISDDLPDLADVMAHPEKYKAPEPEAVVVDEDALLNNIMNVSFKPFDDGTREFEILNEFDTPTVSDIAQEFSQFENFSIASDDNIPVASSESTNDDFETLFNNEYVDFDNPEHVNQALVENTEEQLQIAKQESSAKDLLEKIRRRREEREAAIVEDVQQATEELLVKPVQKKEAVKLDSDVQCVIDGESFKVLSSVNFSENTGCHLVKNSSGYAVMAYIGDKLTKIKTFDELKSEKIQARLSEVLDDGSCRYLIRVGIAKFIVNANSSSVEFIMDL